MLSPASHAEAAQPSRRLAHAHAAATQKLWHPAAQGLKQGSGSRPGRTQRREGNVPIEAWKYCGVCGALISMLGTGVEGGMELFRCPNAVLSCLANLQICTRASTEIGGLVRKTRNSINRDI